MFDYVKFSESYSEYLNSSFKRYITHSIKRHVLEEISVIKNRAIEVMRHNTPGIELLLNYPDPDPDPNNDDRPTNTNRNTLLNDQELLEFQVEVRDVLERFYPLINQDQKSSARALVFTARVPVLMYDMWKLDL